MIKCCYRNQRKTSLKFLFPKPSYFAVGDLVGTGALWPQSLNATYLEPFDVLVQLLTVSPGAVGAALIYPVAGTRKGQGGWSRDDSFSLPVRCHQPNPGCHMQLHWTMASSTQ